MFPSVIPEDSLLIFNTAKSVSGSIPIIAVPYSLPSWSFTKMSSDPAITWKLVMICPWALMITPEPWPVGEYFFFLSAFSLGSIK